MATPPLRLVGSIVVVLVASALELINGSDIGEIRGTALTVPFPVMIGLIVAVYSTLLLRKRAPVKVFAVLWVFSLSGLVLEAFNPFVGLFVALHTVAARCTRRKAAAALALVVVPCLVNAVNSAEDRFHDEVPLAVSAAVILGLYMVLAAAAWSVGRASYADARRAEEERARTREAAVHDERLRLARELHDIVAHGVTGMLLQAAGAKAVLQTDASGVAETLDRVEHLGVQTMRELRRLLGLLRSVESAPSSPLPSTPSIEELAGLVSTARAAGSAIDVRVSGDPQPLDPSVSLTAYRLVQEALTNVAKHAGPRSPVRIEVEWRPEELALCVENVASAGRPPPPTVAAISTGRGLLGLRERVELVHGRFEAGRTGAGYRVAAVLPCRTGGTLS